MKDGFRVGVDTRLPSSTFNIIVARSNNKLVGIFKTLSIVADYGVNRMNDAILTVMDDLTPTVDTDKPGIYVDHIQYERKHRLPLQVTEFGDLGTVYIRDSKTKEPIYLPQGYNRDTEIYGVMKYVKLAGAYFLTYYPKGDPMYLYKREIDVFFPVIEKLGRTNIDDLQKGIEL